MANESLTQDQIFRLAHIGGSEASALVGLSPYDTPWSLYQQKIGAIPPDDFDKLGERQRWGLNLERAIINEVARRLNRPVRKWMGMPLSNGVLGGHPDARIVSSGKTAAIVEIKAMDWLIFKGHGEEPPDHQIIQLQVYMGLAGVERGYLCILVGGNDLRIFEYDFRPKLFELLHGKAVVMLERVAEKRPPPVNYEKDAEAINEVYRSGGGKESIDLTGDNMLTDAMAIYVEQSAIEKAAKEAKKAAAAEIKHKAGDADMVICGEWRCKFSVTDEKPDITITADMVGEIIKGRKGSRAINAPRRIGG